MEFLSESQDCEDVSEGVVVISVCGPRGAASSVPMLMSEGSPLELNDFAFGLKAKRGFFGSNNFAVGLRREIDFLVLNGLASGLRFVPVFGPLIVVARVSEKRKATRGGKVRIIGLTNAHKSEFQGVCGCGGEERRTENLQGGVEKERRTE